MCKCFFLFNLRLFLKRGVVWWSISFQSQCWSSWFVGSPSPPASLPSGSQTTFTHLDHIWCTLTASTIYHLAILEIPKILSVNRSCAQGTCGLPSCNPAGLHHMWRIPAWSSVCQCQHLEQVCFAKLTSTVGPNFRSGQLIMLLSGVNKIWYSLKETST